MELGSIFSAIDLQDNEVVLNTIDDLLTIALTGQGAGGDSQDSSHPVVLPGILHLRCSDGDRAILEEYVSLVRMCSELADKVTKATTNKN